MAGGARASRRRAAPYPSHDNHCPPDASLNYSSMGILASSSSMDSALSGVPYLRSRRAAKEALPSYDMFQRNHLETDGPSAWASSISPLNRATYYSRDSPLAW